MLSDRLWLRELSSTTGPLSRAEFLKARHAGFGVSQVVVVGLAERATNRTARSSDRVIRGDDNEVHRVHLSDSSTVFVRISRAGQHSFDHEVRAMDHARNVGVPVPALLALEVVDGDPAPRQAMVIAAAAGRQLSDLTPALTANQRRSAWTDAGTALARVHEVQMSGVWRPDADGHWPDPAQYRRQYVSDRLAEGPLLEAAGLSATEIDRAFDLLAADPDVPAELSQVLCHGDFSAEHVFVDQDLHVSGVIDWGMWRSSSAVSDLAVASLHLGQDDFDPLVNGHSYAMADQPTMVRQLDVSIITEALGHIAWSQSVGDTGGNISTVSAVRKALRRLALG